MVDVDEFELAETGDDGTAPPPSSGSRRRPQPWPWVLAAIALVGVGAANATPVPLADGSGIDVGLVELDLSQPPTTLWSADLEFPALFGAEGDHALVVEGDDGEGRDVVGIDLATGTERWRYRDQGYTCTWSTPVACVEHPGTPSALLVTIDRSDGTRHSYPHPSAVAVAAVGTDLVVIETTDAVEETVILRDQGGSERWRVTVDAVEAESFPFWTQLEVTEDSVVSHNSGLSIDLATGAVSMLTRWVISDGVSVEFTGPHGNRRLVHTPEGALSLLSTEMVLQLDDDLGGQVVIAQDGHGAIIASLRADETELWRLPSSAPACYPSARLRGTLVMQCWESGSEGLVALDLSTGAELWSHPAPASVLAADAGNVLVVDYSTGELAALDVTDGRSLWKLSMPVTGISGVTPISNGLLLTTGHSLQRLLFD